MEQNWKEIEDKGFLVVRQFLSNEDIAMVRDDYLSQANASRKNGNYDLQFTTGSLLSHFEPKLRAVSDAIRAATGIDTDTTVAGIYFAIERGIGFPWHQDHESYFLFQNHYNNLNFYIPILKPDATKSNLSVVPFDSLRKASSEFGSRLKGGGAATFRSNGLETEVVDDENDVKYTMPFDINRLAATPDLNAGDLLLLRGDMIHRTQDTDTPRVAVSFRRLCSKSILCSSKLAAAGPKKREYMDKTGVIYDRLSECFVSQDKSELSLGEILPHIQRFLMPDRI